LVKVVKERLKCGSFCSFHGDLLPQMKLVESSGAGRHAVSVLMERMFSRYAAAGGTAPGYVFSNMLPSARNALRWRRPD
jgi:hypothetical protein